MTELVCKDCQKLHIGCHGGCEWYRAYNRAKEKERKRRHDEAVANDSTSSNWCYDGRGVK